MPKKISNIYLKKNLVNFMTVLIPFTPHLANECLEKLDKSIEKWPKINNQSTKRQKIKIAIQINGKTRDVIEIQKDSTEKEVISISKKNKKINKNLENKSIVRIVFVKNKIINYLIK